MENLIVTPDLGIIGFSVMAVLIALYYTLISACKPANNRGPMSFLVLFLLLGAPVFAVPMLFIPYVLIWAALVVHVSGVNEVYGKNYTVAKYQDRIGGLGFGYKWLTLAAPVPAVICPIAMYYAGAPYFYLALPWTAVSLYAISSHIRLNDSESKLAVVKMFVAVYR